jgi:hypothetical protein
MSSKQRYHYWRMLPGPTMFEQPTGAWATSPKDAGAPKRAHAITLSPQTARALYPESEEMWYKSSKPDSYALLDGKPYGDLRPKYGSDHPDELKLTHGGALCRQFWIGSLGNTNGITATIHGSVPSGGTLDGLGSWSIILNGKEFGCNGQSLTLAKDASDDGWRNWSYDFELPLRDLSEGMLNTVGIGSSKKGDEVLYLRETVNDIEPPEACFAAKL